ncbi:DUF885 domain-containing protein [Undibacterium sp. SXout7W]|uniref:DUF885 domain-containing protein n=1 Tax=Undibacterium sp. SXout7W TaxID=3413049 RepID=UPI003BF01030
MRQQRSFQSIALNVLTISVLSCVGSVTLPAYAAEAGKPAIRMANLRLATTDAERLLSLAETYYQQQAIFEPLSATFNGDNRYDDRLPMTLQPVIRANHTAMLRNIEQKLSGVDRSKLSAADMVTYDCLQYEIQSGIKMAQFKDYLLPINQMDSVPVTLAQFASGQSAQLLTTPKQYETYLRRIKALPTWLKQATINMREGMRQGIVLPKALVNSTLPQYAQLLSDQAEDQAYYLPIRHFPDNFSQADKNRLTKAYKDAIQNSILPALREFNTFLNAEYLPASRNSTGWNALPEGERWYRAWVEDQTTTNLSPDDIHTIGLKEVARIQQKYVTLGPQLGYHGDPKALPAWIDTQNQYRPFKTEKDILDAYRDIDKKVREKLPTLFGKTPKAALDIRPEPEISRQTASDHYSPPAIDGSRPGVFWAVINNPADYANTGMKTLFLHEGQPGHHFHLATLQELDVPRFRKVGGNNAYTEGWALYAETLGREMGLFDNDPNSYLGHLSDEMLRATRLVVDTGMHAKGWTREQGIQYLQEVLGYSEAASRQAIERYMAWPGQALGYKIGSLKIMELRHKAEAALGNKFDLRQFHDAILSDGTLPLSLLETKMNKWIEDQKNHSMMR